MAKQEISYPGLQVSEDYSFEKVSWIVQRIGKVLLVLFVIGCLLGLVGKGILSEQKASTDSAVITYQLFGRNLSPTQIHIQLDEDSRPLTIEMSKSLFNKYQIEQIVPEPTNVTVRENTYMYTFDSQSLGRNTVLSFYIQPQELGMYSGTIKVGNDKKVSINQFIYP